MELVHIDTCLSCYHPYNHEYTLQVAVDNTTTYMDVKHALKDYDTWSNIAYQLEINNIELTNDKIDELVDDLFYLVELTEVVDSTLEESDDCDSVYMFFALVD